MTDLISFILDWILDINCTFRRQPFGIFKGTKGILSSLVLLLLFEEVKLIALLDKKL